MTIKTAAQWHALFVRLNEDADADEHLHDMDDVEYTADQIESTIDAEGGEITRDEALLLATQVRDLSRVAV